MGSTYYLWWIVLAPLLGSAICGVLHFQTLAARRARADAAGLSALAPWVASGAIGAAFALSLLGFLRLVALAPDARTLVSAPWRWIDVEGLSFHVRMVLDPLSSTMTLVVTGVGLLIHVYAAGYMRGDPGYAKFFAYLNLFVCAMLLLVLSSNLLGLFIGWEGVGLCSYLLIGFWYQKGWPAEAAQKAFVVNRIGDALFLVGTFLLVRLVGGLDAAAINAGIPALLAEGRGLELTFAALLLFGGACGKSAQLPLFVWLPDAMAGPTPVSALIHAATMVTAGIYLVVRLNPLFAAVPEVLLLMGVVAALTAFIAGTTALVQRDIKKVLAYSTVSQLGFMFLGLASGAWAAAIFHLVTHAFFKALLFLGAGSVIHGMHEEQDMARMGGLRRHMPATFITFMAGAAALSGLPLLSGYFSKDGILEAVFAGGGIYYALWAVGLLTAAVTAFYTWRMVALVFFGKERFDVAHVHPHESPAVMTAPLVALAVLSVLGGLLGLPRVLGLPNLLAGWLEPVVRSGDAILAARHGEHHLAAGLELALLVLGAAVALYFAHRGFHAYTSGPARDEELARARPKLAARLQDAWGFDTAYRRLIVQPIALVAFLIAVVIDQFALDGVVNGAGTGAKGLGRRLRGMADRSVASYALWMGGGAALLGLFWIWGGLR